MFSSPPPHSKVLTFSTFCLLLSYIERLCLARNISHLGSILKPDSWFNDMLRLLDFIPCSCFEELESLSNRDEMIQLCKPLPISKSDCNEVPLIDIEEPPSTSTGKTSLTNSAQETATGMDHPLVYEYRELKQEKIIADDYSESKKFVPRFCLLNLDREICLA